MCEQEHLRRVAARRPARNGGCNRRVQSEAVSRVASRHACMGRWTDLYTHLSRPPLYATENVLSGSSAHTESVCTAKDATQRCWPRSHSLMVWSEDPERHSVPSVFNASALPPGRQQAAISQLGPPSGITWPPAAP
jgi:hypothetical protein